MSPALQETPKTGFVTMRPMILFAFLFIQNIFLGEDIRKQLPRESAEFDDVNVKWKVIMTRLNKDKNALRGTHHDGKNENCTYSREICIEEIMFSPIIMS